MSRRGSVLLLAMCAALASSYRQRVDYRIPCVTGSVVLEDWDPNRPLYLKWWEGDMIPTGPNLRESIVLQTLDGEPIEYWAEAPGPSVVHLCAKGGLEPDTEYEWRVRQFVNTHTHHLPVPYFKHTGIVRFRTAATSELPPIDSARDCRRFEDWEFEGLPVCTSAWIDNDFDGRPSLEDCNDADPTVFPGALEQCDGIDNDCDGAIDEGFSFRVWIDADGDEFGDPDMAVDLEECGAEPPPGTVSNGIDCDDTNAAIHPAAEDVPDNGIDEDCDGHDATILDTGASDTGDTG